MVYKLNTDIVKKIMLNKGITINMLCERMCVSRVTVYRLLNGNIKGKGKGKIQIKTVFRLSRALEVPVEILVRR